MNFIEIENEIININFFILFITMLFYWFQSALLIPSKWSFLSSVSIIFTGLLQTSLVCFRWIGSGHFPLSNLYESLLFLSWVLTVLLGTLTRSPINFQLVSDSKLFKVDTSRFNLSKSNLLDPLVGSILTPLILLVNTFACFLLPNQLKMTTALVPALQSNWLVMHVTVMMLSYAALLAGCLLSICYLILVFFWSLDAPHLSTETINSNGQLFIDKDIETVDQLAFVDGSSDKLQSSSATIEPFINGQLAATLDNLSYRILSLGFPLLTIGILSGAVWANQTWGSYWSWDPKETWALITWFVFAIYLHTRISTGWTGKKSAFIASFGFIIIWICYLGVNLLGKGLHSYGFFS